jgi:thiosulfate dehydrogenase (quinone) large subunit
MTNSNSDSWPTFTYSPLQLWSLVILRIFIGWHFLYEGLVKLFNPYWSSIGYLLESKGLFSSLFISLAASPAAVRVVDFLNIWGLILIGFGLIVGLFTRISSILGMILLLLYYLSQPPFIGLESALPTEGSYLIVNKTVIEMAALLVLFAFPSGQYAGLDLFLSKRK